MPQRQVVSFFILNIITGEESRLGVFMKSKVVTINLRGGLFQSPRAKIQQVLEEESVNGWKVKFVLPPNPNPLFIVVQLLLVFITIDIYFPLPSYMILFKRD